MTIIHQPSTVLDFIYKQKAKGLKVGFVPTMGALHEGHIKLVKTAAAASDVTVVSIFVNPTQFNDPADYRKYPNRREEDIKLLAGSGAHVLYLPPPEAVYPNGTDTLETYDLGYLETVLEGKYRPGHFQGVCQVMARLLKAIRPDYLFMGQKDYQQCMVVKKLLGYLDFPVQLITCPTVREADGLAMSSRNLRLSPDEREKATAIYQTLQFVKANIGREDINVIKTGAFARLELEGFKVDYIEIADAETLELITSPSGKPLVILIAAFLGEVRLIDNMLI